MLRVFNADRIADEYHVIGDLYRVRMVGRESLDALNTVN